MIVCDDGSTDDLEGALAPFLERITLIRKENGGEATAKNAAAHEASGDFLVILDADDVYLPERLAALAELARARPDLDVLTSDAVLEVDGEAVRRCYTPELPFEVEDQRSAILRRNFVFGLAARAPRALPRGRRIRRVDSVRDGLGPLGAADPRRLARGRSDGAARSLPPPRRKLEREPRQSPGRARARAREGGRSSVALRRGAECRGRVDRPRTAPPRPRRGAGRARRRASGSASTLAAGRLRAGTRPRRRA